MNSKQYFALIFSLLLIILYGCQNEKNNQIENFSGIPSGTFRYFADSKEIIVQADDPSGYLIKCKEENCSKVYLNVDANGLFNKDTSSNYLIDKDKFTAVGIINNFTINYEPAEWFQDYHYIIYQISYEYKLEKYNSTYRDDNICIQFKGGGKKCYEPAKINSPVVLRVNSANQSRIETIWVFDKIQEAEIVKLNL